MFIFYIDATNHGLEVSVMLAIEKADCEVCKLVFVTVFLLADGAVGIGVYLYLYLYLYLYFSLQTVKLVLVVRGTKLLFLLAHQSAFERDANKQTNQRT